MYVGDLQPMFGQYKQFEILGLIKRNYKNLGQEP